MKDIIWRARVAEFSGLGKVASAWLVRALAVP